MRHGFWKNFDFVRFDMHAETTTHISSGKDFAKSVADAISLVFTAEAICCKSAHFVWSKPRESSSAYGQDTVEVNAALGFDSKLERDKALATLHNAFFEHKWRFFAIHNHKHQKAALVSGIFQSVSNEDQSGTFCISFNVVVSSFYSSEVSPCNPQERHRGFRTFVEARC